LPIFVRPWLADMRHVPPKETKTRKIIRGRNDTMRPFNSSLVSSPGFRGPGFVGMGDRGLGIRLEIGRVWDSGQRFQCLGFAAPPAAK